MNQFSTPTSRNQPSPNQIILILSHTMQCVEPTSQSLEWMTTSNILQFLQVRHCSRLFIFASASALTLAPGRAEMEVATAARTSASRSALFGDILRLEFLLQRKVETRKWKWNLETLSNCLSLARSPRLKVSDMHAWSLLDMRHITKEIRRKMGRERTKIAHGANSLILCPSLNQNPMRNEIIRPTIIILYCRIGSADS